MQGIRPIFRGGCGDLIKVLWSDAHGILLYAKQLERGRIIWPSAADGILVITPAQLTYLLEGIDWRHPQHTLAPYDSGVKIRISPLTGGCIRGCHCRPGDL